MAQCSRCYGSGYDGSCYICHGSGRDRSSDGTYETSCSSCSGSGKLRCSACGGSGQVADSSSSSGSSYSSGSSSYRSSSNTEWKANDGSVWSNERQAMLRNTALEGLRLFDRGDYDGAIDACTAAIEADIRSSRQDNIFCYAKRGEAYKAKGLWDLAIADFTVAIKDNNYDRKVHAGRYYNRGDSYLKKGDYSNAMSDANAVIGYGYYIGDAYNVRGLCYAKTGKRDLAIVNYKIAADYGEKFSLNNLQKIGENYSPLSYNSDNSCHYSAGERLLDAGDLPGAIAAFNLVDLPKEQTDAKNAKTLGKSFLDLGYLYLKAGARDRGVQCIKYSANYNNKEAKKYLRENRIRHRRLLWEPNRNGFVSFLFGLVCGAGILFTITWILVMLFVESWASFLTIIGVLVVGIASAIISGGAWSSKKNILFAFMLALAAPGWLSFAGLVPDSLKSFFIYGVIFEVGSTAIVDNGTIMNSIDDENKIWDRSNYRDIPEGVEVKILSEGIKADNNWWVQVEYNGETGYMKTSYLKKKKSSPENTQNKQTAQTATMTQTANFRSGASTNDTVIRQLQQGDTVTLTGETSGGWTKVSHNGDTGWVSTEFLKKH